MTLVYLILLGLLALAHHSEWHHLHPWSLWFVVLVIAAVLDLVGHGSRFVTW